MKKIFNSQRCIFVFSFIMLCLFRVISFAQDSAASSGSTQSTTTKTEQTTTVQPWVWVVGGVVLLLILVALFRKNKSDATTHTDKVTYTKTTTSDDNT